MPANPTDVLGIKCGTLQNYLALLGQNKVNADALYFITDKGLLYRGSSIVAPANVVEATPDDATNPTEWTIALTYYGNHPASPTVVSFDVPTVGGATPLYGTCPTAGSTKAKTVNDLNGPFRLVDGALIFVRFANANAKASPTLNVMGTGAKPIVRYGSTAAGASSAYSWYSGSVHPLIYDATNDRWMLVGWLNSTYSDMVGASGSSGGTHGLAPAPQAGDGSKFLRGDGTWAYPSPGGAAHPLTGATGVTEHSEDVALGDLEREPYLGLHLHATLRNTGQSAVGVAVWLEIGHYETGPDGTKWQCGAIVAATQVLIPAAASAHGAPDAVGNASITGQLVGPFADGMTVRACFAATGAVDICPATPLGQRPNATVLSIRCRPA